MKPVDKLLKEIQMQSEPEKSQIECYQLSFEVSSHSAWVGSQSRKPRVSGGVEKQQLFRPSSV